ncbi:MAG: hypothetical protein ACLFR7_11620 [Opitutales bacterium]
MRTDGAVLVESQALDGTTEGFFLDGAAATAYLKAVLRHGENSHLLSGLMEGTPRFGTSIASDESLLRGAGLEPREYTWEDVDHLMGSEEADPARFELLVLAAGYLLLKENGGVWDFRRDGEVWEPWVVLPNGRPIPVFKIVYEEAIEAPQNGEQGSIAVTHQRSPVAA